MSDPIKKQHSQYALSTVSEMDKELLDKMTREQLYEFLFMHIKDIWRVDGLYFLGIEKRNGTEEATDVDAECWKYMGKVEAKELKGFLGIDDPNPEQILFLLRHTAWALCHELKSFSVKSDGSVSFIVEKCRTQLIRLEKGLQPHPCKRVREGYLNAFVKECNPLVSLEAICCPPDRNRDDIWCEWSFFLEK